MTCQTVGDLLGAIERIAPLISEHAASAEADRHLSDAVYHAMYDAGLYGMLAPKAYGGIELHPMNYFFLAAAFFSFHLLLAYLVDHISIHVAFVVCSAVSIFLVVSYLRLVVGMRFASGERIPRTHEAA